MNREACKFFSGSFAALAYVHGAYAIATSTGVLNEPIFLGRRWGVGYMWTEAAVYTAISVGLGYLGWSRKTSVAQLHVAPATAAEDDSTSGAAAKPMPPVSL